MKKYLTIRLLGVALLAACGTAQAGFTFQALLTSDQEVPINTVPFQGSSGIAIFVLNDAMTRLTYDVQLTGLDLRGVTNGGPFQAIPGDTDVNDNVTRIHIHRNVAGLNGNIVFGMIDALATLRDDLNDLLVDAQNLRVTGAWDLTEGSLVAGQVTNLGNELNNLLAGGLYINIHTSDRPGGEIRGQILRVPEPGTLALLGLGLLGLSSPAMRRRRRRTTAG